MSLPDLPTDVVTPLVWLTVDVPDGVVVLAVILVIISIWNVFVSPRPLAPLDSVFLSDSEDFFVDLPLNILDLQILLSPFIVAFIS